MCGCRSQQRNVGRRVITSPAVRSTPGLQATQTPRQLQLRAQALAATQEANSVGGLSKEQRDIERRRRAAIARRTLGK